MVNISKYPCTFNGVDLTQPRAMALLQVSGCVPLISLLQVRGCIYSVGAWRQVAYELQSLGCFCRYIYGVTLRGLCVCQTHTSVSHQSAIRHTPIASMPNATGCTRESPYIAGVRVGWVILGRKYCRQNVCTFELTRQTRHGRSLLCATRGQYAAKSMLWRLMLR